MALCIDVASIKTQFPTNKRLHTSGPCTQKTLLAGNKVFTLSLQPASPSVFPSVHCVFIVF